MRLRFSRRSEIDLEEIGDYVANDSPRNAANFVAKLRDACQRIGRMPAGYRLRPELGEGVRSSAFRSYTIFFVVERDEVLIVRILHGARDITAHDLEEDGNA
jgi:toxin ParE1/3/4